MKKYLIFLLLFAFISVDCLEFNETADLYALPREKMVREQLMERDK